MTIRRTKEQDEEFALILKSVMESGCVPEAVRIESIDYLVREGMLDEHGNRRFHVTESGALLYGEIFLRLRRIQ